MDLTHHFYNKQLIIIIYYNYKLGRLDKEIIYKFVTDNKQTVAAVFLEVAPQLKKLAGQP